MPKSKSAERARNRRRVSMSEAQWYRLDRMAEMAGRERSQLLAAIVDAAAAKLLPRSDGEAAS